MPSFRAKVLDALDIHKKTIKLQVNERFPKTFSTIAASTTDPAYFGEPAVQEGIYSETGFNTVSGVTTTCNAPVDYCISKCVKQTTIGPSFSAGTGETAQLQKLDVLGFVVGDRPGLSNHSSGTVDTTADPVTGASGLQNTAGYPTIYLNSYPDTLKKSGSIANYNFDFADPANTYGLDFNKYSGFHFLNGLYDPKCKELQHMRKSALPIDDLDTVSTGTEHSHKDWPDNLNDQIHLMNENPYSDSLYYHQMRLSMLITGITIPGSSEKASNHRGVVRMLILRPRMPSVKTRWTGDTNQPVINMGFPPHWDTDLFYSGKKTLAGRMDSSILRNTVNRTRDAYKHNNDNTMERAEDYSHMSPTFGFENRKKVDPLIDLDPTSIHYSHEKPQQGVPHDLTAFDMFSAPINRDAYSVVADKTFTLDTRHHGVASTRLENIVIPFNKKVKFGGRKPLSTFDIAGENCPLDPATFDEPLNLPSRPIIMFLSLDQKISCQVTGYTAISEC